MDHLLHLLSFTGPFLNYLHLTFLFCLSAVKVIQPYRVVSINGTAQVQCFIEPQPSFHLNQPSNDQKRQYPYPNPEEVRVSLLKGLHGTQKLCSSVPNFQDHGQTGVENEEEVTVSGLKATDTDVYRCGIEVLYPPPYLRLTGNGTLIHVLGEMLAQDNHTLTLQDYPQCTCFCLFLSLTFPLTTDNPHCPLEGPQTAIAHQGVKRRTMRVMRG
uniref:Immunoglobulin V-set domain-containing protein n=1 Tax=Seriola lalandi dorsalis TaxID=1841481 RepID=A0A3B4YYQ4_SERLL